jgi:hypothetical protein
VGIRGLLPLSGIAFVALIVLGIALSGATPDTDAPAVEVGSFYDEEENRQRIATYVLALSIPFLLFRRGDDARSGGMAAWPRANPRVAGMGRARSRRRTLGSVRRLSRTPTVRRLNRYRERRSVPRARCRRVSPGSRFPGQRSSSCARRLVSRPPKVKPAKQATALRRANAVISVRRLAKKPNGDGRYPDDDEQSENGAHDLKGRHLSF